MSSPAIRFAGFTDDWEERKLGDFVNITTGKLDANAMTEDGEFDFYTSGIKKYRIDVAAFEGPAITIAGNGATVGYMHLADGKFNAYQRTYVLTAFQADRQFLFSEIGNRLPQKITEEARAGNIPYIVMDMLTGLNIAVPSNSNEQKNIAAIFSCLDRLITLHQREHDKTVNIKKALLEKMFPKDGEDKPEIRFAGFTEAWKQRKLGEFATRIVRKNKQLESALPLTISSTYGLVDQIAYFNNRVASRDVSNYYLIKRGEFAYNKSYSDGFPWGTIKRLDRYEMGVLSTLYIVFSLNTDMVDSDYFVTYYETDNWHREVAIRAAEGARNHGLLNISAEDFFDTAFKYPKGIGEQVKIGQLFAELDRLIALHQRELTKLQNIKKALLEKMFV